MVENLTGHCWCGNSQLASFSTDYALCSQCGTLVSQAGLSAEQAKVQDDNHDFYGKEYWLSHQTENYGLPTIHQRVRHDLPERCLYWLKTLLKYKLPAAKVLELGSAHGGFVALMKWAGFEAMGLELSPWVVEYAKQTFEVPMLLGAVEEQSLEPESLDAIVLFDVLEHLPDPLATMHYCASLLKTDGIFIVQMPNYQEGKSYSDMVDQNDRFLDQMKAIEHLHLFNERSAHMLFEKIGYPHLQFEPQLFDYDMFFIASRQPLQQPSPQELESGLATHSTGRLIQALLDKSSEFDQVNAQFHHVSHQLQQLDNQFQQLESRYVAAEADRADRLSVIEQQGQQIAALHAQIHQSLAETTALYEQNHQFQQDIAALQEQLQSTQGQLERSHDKIQRLEAKVERTQTKLKESWAEIAAMQSSKFWQLRTQWFKVKQRLGLRAD